MAKRFGLRSRVSSKLEKMEMYKEKIEKIVKDLDGSVSSMHKLNIESRILKEAQISDQLKEDIRSISSKESLTPLTTQQLERHQANLDISETVSNVKLHQIQASTRIRENNDCVKTWQTVLTPSVYHPNVKLSVNFKTCHEEKAPMPSVHHVKFEVHGLENNTELVPAIEHCQEESDIQLFIQLIDQYLTLDDTRSKLIESVTEDSCISLKETNILEFRDHQNRVLVHLCITIHFDYNKLDWSLSWICKFTEAGTEVARSCNIPAELIKEGNLEGWSVEYCVETLGKMASLQPTPVKSVHEEDDSTQETPLNSQSHRPPKRRLVDHQ